MSAATFPNIGYLNHICVRADDRHGWGFLLLLMLVATLFVRPADLIPALDAWPVYQFLIVCCFVVAARTMLRMLAHHRLSDQPVTASLLVLLLAVGASHLSHGFFWAARMSMYEVGKLLALYILIRGLISTPERLVLFLRWLSFTITAVAALALLDRFDIISVAALESIKDRGAGVQGHDIFVERIRGTGIFQDPNDFGLILVTGVIFCVSFLVQPHAGWLRYKWLIPCGILLTALAMTHSRGALLSLLCAFPAVLAYHRGGKWGGWLLLALPVSTIFFSGRMTDISSVNQGTGQSRIQIWSESLTVWRTYPVLGLGEGLLVDEIGAVSHNSFLHCYAELGVLGGTAFLSSFLAAGLGLWALRDAERCHIGDDSSDSKAKALVHQRGFIFAVIVAYAAGVLTLSRQFVAPTYVILGIAASVPSLLSPNSIRWRLGNQFLFVSLCCSIVSLLATYLAVRLLVRW